MGCQLCPGQLDASAAIYDGDDDSTLEFLATTSRYRSQPQPNCKKLNQDEQVAVKPDQMGKLTEFIHTHTKKVSALLDASLSRWSIESGGNGGDKQN